MTAEPPSPSARRPLVAWAIAVSILVLAPAVQGWATPDTDSLRETAVVRAVKASSPAVVNIYTETVIETRSPFRSPFLGNPFFEEFFGNRRGSTQRRTRTSLGTGVIVRPDGIVVTNHHVIERATTIRVLLNDNREFEAGLIGSDSDSDLAVLRIETDEKLPHLVIGDEDSLLIGETVIAIGNPFGLSHTVTTGVLSATGRSLNAGDVVLHDFLQTDASINPGNSGGPLLDVTGRLIGINTAIQREAEGIGFAIPVWKVRQIVEQLLDHGSVRPPWIGFEAQNLTPELAFHFRVEPGSGVLVRSVEKGSPAFAAGISPGDVVTKVQGNRIRNTSELARNFRGITTGDKLKLTVRTGEEIRRTELTVKPLPSALIDEFAWKALGVEVGDPAGKTGMMVRRVRRDSSAERVGLRPGDIIARIAGRSVTTAEAFRKHIAPVRQARSVALSVVRDRRIYHVTVPLPQY